MAVPCEVIPPPVIPRAPGGKVTDKRDYGRLAQLRPAGELVAIRVPGLTKEAVRGSVPDPERRG
jgi:hypothetical protein